MKWLSIALAVALLGSNAAWVYKMVDHGVADTHREDSCRHAETALRQALSIVRLAKGRRVHKEMVTAARTALPDATGPFEKDGETFVGELMLKFDADDAFVDVSPSWGE